MFDIIAITKQNVCLRGTEMVSMDYKAMIIKMLDKASDMQLKRLYYYIKAFLGLG